jgi:hypothetical protein
MNTTKTILCGAAIALALALAASPARAVVYLSDGFEYANDAAMTAAGWAVLNTPNATEVGTKWTLYTGSTTPGTQKAHWFPPSTNGAPAATTGKFIISDSDSGGDNVNNTDDTVPDSGGSYDLYTPTFSTVGGASAWLHVDLAAMLNDNGRAIFDIDVSNNGGVTWNNAFHRVAPGRNLTFSGELLPPATTLPPTTTNTGGYFGRLDLDLSSWATNCATTKVRFRHYEPNDDWWVRMDNVLVDNVPVKHSNTTVFTENFDDGLGNMVRYGAHDYAPDTYPKIWNTDGPVAGQYNYAVYTLGQVTTKGINHLQDAENRFAFIDPLYPSGLVTEDYLATQILDFTGKTGVVLGYQDEILRYQKTDFQITEVRLMRDTDHNGPDDGLLDGTTDELVKTIFSYNNNAVGPEDGEEPWYADRLFSVPEADGQSDVYFVWYYYSNGRPWWAIDSIKVSANGGQPHLGDANNDGKVDDADATILASHWHVQSGAVWGDGDFNADGKVDDKDASILAVNWNWGVSEEGDATVPEPSTLVLVLSAAVVAWLGYRRNH